MRRSASLGFTLILLGLLVIPAAPSLAYEPVVVVDGSTIQGKISFTGTPPAPKKVIPTKDRAVCGGIRDVPQILLDADKGVQNAFVYLKGVEKGKAWENGKKPVVDSEGCEFSPSVQVIRTGDIDLVNSDAVLHNTHGFYDKASVFNVSLRKGQRVTKALAKPGVVRVECDIHGWMLGWIYVADNPYYAVTGKDGSFAFKHVPPGTYTLVVWQKLTGEQEFPVTVKPREEVNAAIDLSKKEARMIARPTDRHASRSRN